MTRGLQGQKRKADIVVSAVLAAKVAAAEMLRKIQQRPNNTQKLHPKHQTKDEHVTVRVQDAAAYLTSATGQKVSNLQLQKILYIADMNFVGSTGKRLVDEDFQAWDYGPVLESLYHKCKAFGPKPVPNIFWSANDINGTLEAKMLDLAWEKLKNLTPGELVETTHSEDGAWVRLYVPGAKQIKITTKDMIEEYERRTKKRG